MFIYEPQFIADSVVDYPCLFSVIPIGGIRRCVYTFIFIKKKGSFMRKSCQFYKIYGVAR